MIIFTPINKFKKKDCKNHMIIITPKKLSKIKMHRFNF